MTTGLGKIYPANKLFALTKHRPLGVMIYNKADFMGVPWETLIKMYRHRIGAKAFPACKQYVDDFLEFLGEHPICKAEQEAANLADIALATFADIRNRAFEAPGVNDANIEKAVRDEAEKASRQHHEDAKRFRQEKLTRPTMSAVSLLPMEELADLAEALVSLTSLRRRVSLSQETVGGPIDVAIISKGDGLIWIKRKHYFEPSLNPSYFERQALRWKQEDSA